MGIVAAVRLGRQDELGVEIALDDAAGDRAQPDLGPAQILQDRELRSRFAADPADQIEDAAVCSSCVPCEKLSRKTSTPASTIGRCTSGVARRRAQASPRSWSAPFRWLLCNTEFMLRSSRLSKLDTRRPASDNPIQCYPRMPASHPWRDHRLETGTGGRRDSVSPRSSSCASTRPTATEPARATVPAAAEIASLISAVRSGKKGLADLDHHAEQSARSSKHPQMIAGAFEPPEERPAA